MPMFPSVGFQQRGRQGECGQTLRAELTGTAERTQGVGVGSRRVRARQGDSS